MKKIIEKINCGDCGNQFPLSKIYKFSWRYNDKTRTYKSGIKIIHTGYHYFCKKCLENIVKM